MGGPDLVLPPSIVLVKGNTIPCLSRVALISCDPRGRNLFRRNSLYRRY